MTSAVRDPKHWRSRAKEARALAELIADPESKRGMLTIADEYEKIAKRAELQSEVVATITVAHYRFDHLAPLTVH